MKYQEIEDEEYSKRVFAKLMYKNGRSEEVELKYGTINELIDLQMRGKNFQKARFYNKKHVLVDDIEFDIPCNEGCLIYFGRKMTMYEYYRRTNTPFPIGQYSETLGREFTFDDLIGKSYIEYSDGTIDTNVEVGAVTLDEIRKMTYDDYSKKPKSL